MTIRSQAFQLLPQIETKEKRTLLNFRLKGQTPAQTCIKKFHLRINMTTRFSTQTHRTLNPTPTWATKRKRILTSRPTPRA